MTTTNNNDGLHEAIQAAYLLWWSSPGGGKGADIGSVMEAAVRDWLASRPAAVVTLEQFLSATGTSLVEVDDGGTAWQIPAVSRLNALLAQQ